MPPLKNSKQNSFRTESFTRLVKALWYISGMISLAFAYIGFVTPGIPFSIFLVFSAYAFSKSSERMHKWIYNHKHFGPFLRNWIEKKVFPLRMKYAMVIVMSSSLALMGLTMGGFNVILLYSACFMSLVAIWAWRYPSSIEDYESRVANGQKIGWFK
jgi:uncharacterized membrane protein YbaN (DUF454 family)